MQPPDCPLDLARHLVYWARATPNRTAWLQVEDAATTPRSWANLAALVYAAQHWLSAMGVVSRQRVALRLPNSLAWPIAVSAVHGVDAIDVPIDPTLVDELAWQRMRDARVTWVLRGGGQHLQLCRLAEEGPPQPVGVLPLQDATCLTEEELVRWDRQLTQRNPWRLSSIQWTSGTTRTPKRVLLSHAALVSNAYGKWHAAPQTQEDLRLTVLSLAHAYARTCDLGTWLISGSAWCAVEGADEFFSIAPRIQPTVVNAVPYLIDRLLRSEPRQSIQQQMGGRLRCLGCGGAALRTDQARALLDEGITPIQGYGLTEMGPVVCSSSTDAFRLGSVGRPIPGVRLRIDADGEIWCRGPAMMLGYEDEPQGTAERCVDGWLRTGDLGRVDEDGFVYLHGRKDEGIVLATGHKVMPLEVEQHCLQISGVQQAVVVALPQGTGVAAVLYCKGPTRPEPVQEFLAGVLPRHAVPRTVVFLERPLTQDAGELTVKGTPRRDLVAQRYLG